MATQTNIGPCDCCGWVCCPGRSPPALLYVTITDTGGCECLDGITFSFDPTSADPIPFSLGAACADHECTVGDLDYPYMEFGCTDQNFPVAITDRLCGCVIAEGSPVESECDPFYLEYDATLSSPVLGQDNCCAGTVTITISETPP